MVEFRKIFKGNSGYSQGNYDFLQVSPLANPVSLVKSYRLSFPESLLCKKERRFKKLMPVLLNF